MDRQKKMEKQKENRSFRQALDRELREHKSSFIVFSLLRILVVVSLIRQCMLQSYESAFLCALTLLFLYLPSWVQVRLRIELPPAFEICVLCFIFAAEILGEINKFYVMIPGWDTVLHTLNGFLCAAVGFSLVVLLNGNEKLKFDLSPFYMALFAFCFSMTVGVVWEFIEFFTDLTFHTDMQKDTVLHSIYSIALDPAKGNKAIGITDITDVSVNGESLGLGGYLDIGLYDTMKDLFVNLIGATVFSVYGFIYCRTKGTVDRAVKDFVPRWKTKNQDYLLQAEEQAKSDGSDPGGGNGGQDTPQ